MAGAELRPKYRVAPVLLNESLLASWCSTLYRSWSFNESVFHELLRVSAVRRYLEAPSSYRCFTAPIDKSAGPDWLHKCTRITLLCIVRLNRILSVAVRINTRLP
jgi:hypothetical protein